MDVLVDGLRGSLQGSHVNEHCWMIVLKDTLAPEEQWSAGVAQKYPTASVCENIYSGGCAGKQLNCWSA